MTAARTRDKISDFRDLLTSHDGIILADLILPELFVVELTIVFVRVAMLPAIKATTTAVEACEPDFPFAVIHDTTRPLFRLAEITDTGARKRGGGCEAIVHFDR